MDKWKPWYILEKPKPWWQRYLLWFAGERPAFWWHWFILIVIWIIVVPFLFHFEEVRKVENTVGMYLGGAMVFGIIGMGIVHLIERKFASIIYKEHWVYTLLLHVEDGKVTETGHALWGKKGIREVASKELLEYCTPKSLLNTAPVEVKIIRGTGTGMKQETLTLSFIAYFTQRSALSLQELYDKIFSRGGSVKGFVTEKLREVVAAKEKEIQGLLYDLATGTVLSEDLQRERAIRLLEIERPFSNISSVEIHAFPITREVTSPKPEEVITKKVITYA